MPQRPFPRLRAYRVLKLVVLALFLICVIGVLFFRFYEGWPWLDSLYMAVMTLATVGYRELHPLSPVGQLFNTFFIFFGVGLVFLAIGATTQALVELELSQFFGRRRMEREIARLSDHFIICGAGRVGRSVARELARKPVPFLFLETNADKTQRLPEDWLFVLGDATQEATLRAARIEHAAGLVAATTADATNVFIIMAARGLNPRLKIIARASEESAEKHLLAAGADQVVSPYSFVGHRIAQSFLRPNVLSFLDIATRRGGQPELEIEEVQIEPGSRFVGQTIESARIRQDMGAIVLAIKHDGAAMSFNPAPDETILAGDFLVAMGNPDGLRRLEQSASRRS